MRRRTHTNRLLSIILVFVVVIGSLSFEGLGVENVHAASPLNTAKVGDIITFGRYEQDNNMANGKEPIEWQVLAKENNKILVVSKYALDNKPYYPVTYSYNVGSLSVTWETCSLRKWLDNEFKNAAFNATEQSQIPRVTVTADKNPYHNTSAGKNTQDQIFLLSVVEAEKYFSSENNNKARRCAATAYAKAQGAWTSSTYKTVDGEDSCAWWLRSPGLYSDDAAIVYLSAERAGYYFTVDSDCAVRPAMWINIAGGTTPNPPNPNDNIRNAEILSGKISLDRSGSDKKKYGDGQADYYCDENWFKQSSSSYNHDMCRFACLLSTMLYGTNNSFTNLLNKLNYDNIKQFEDPDGNKATGWIASKSVKLDNIKTNIITVVIRGTDGEEWFDNFNPGTGPIHKGFYRGANYVIENLKNHINTNNLAESPMKILITGHSRGAAVANLVGWIIDKGGLENANKDNTYVYTFATPNVSTNEAGDITGRDNISSYNNIINIINPEDFVTKVMPSAWGYGRFGINYVLPSSTTDSKQRGTHFVDYNEYLKSLRKKWAEYCPDHLGGYWPYIGGTMAVDSYMSYMTFTIKNIDDFYYRPLWFHDILPQNYSYRDGSMHTLYTKTLASFMVEKYEKEGLKNFILASIYWGTPGLNTFAFFMFAQGLDQARDKINEVIKLYDQGLYDCTGISPYFEDAHMCATYLAAVNSLTKSEIQQKRKALYGIVNCPVDVTVKDSEGIIVGQIINNEVIDDNTSISMAVNGDSKSFYLPGSNDYNVELTGNDNGEMDYSLCEIDADTGETCRVYYESVPLVKNKSYSQEISADKAVEKNALKDSSQNEVDATEVITDSETTNLKVEVSVEGIGEASGFDNLTKGDYVTLSANTDSNNSFLGWYDEGGNLVTDQTNYSFSIRRNEKFIAKFTNVVVDTQSISFKDSTVDLEVGDIYNNTITILPENATYKYLADFESSNDKVVEVDEFGLVKAISEGTAHVTATTIDKKASKSFDVIVKNTNNQEPSTNHIITFNPNGGTVTPISATTITSNGKEVLTELPTPIWDAEHTFDGWFTLVTGGEKITTSTVFTGDTTIYAHWTVKKQDPNPSPSPNPSVVKISILNAEISGVIGKKYTGKAITQNPTVKVDGITLKNGTDYTLSYRNNVYAGTATMIITGKDNYTGTKSVNFNISLTAEQAKKMENATVIGLTDKAYTGKAIKPFITVKMGNKTLKSKKDFTVSYKNNKKVGTATITLKGKGKIKGTKKVTFKITKAANPLKVTGKTAKVKNVNKNKQTLAVSKVIKITKKGQGKVTYKKVDGDTRITMNSKGKVTVAKGTPAKEYKIKANVKASGNGNYKPVTRTVTFKVKVS